MEARDFSRVRLHTYENDVTAGEEGFKRNDTTSRFLSFGNTLINNGGEIGIHGYNHQPLCLAGTDERMKLGDYKLWPSMHDMEAAVKYSVGIRQKGTA